MIDHVAANVSDVEQAKTFYVSAGALGLLGPGRVPKRGGVSYDPLSVEHRVLGDEYRHGISARRPRDRLRG